jgi:hypothetical protein
MIAYFDSSALVKRLFSESGSDLADEIWESADTIAASELVYPETRAAVAAAHRAGRIDARGLRETICALEQMYQSVDVMRVDDSLASAAGGLAERHRLRGYDAVHLASALSIPARRVVMATWDRELSVASAEIGLAVVPQEVSQAAG